MKKKTKNILTVLSAAALVALLSGLTGGRESVAKAEDSRTVADVVGVTTAGGYYAFDPTVSSLEDGANQVLELGSNVIKLWLAASSMTTSYAYNVDWESYNVKNCVDLLSSQPYRNVLDMDFSTYVFETITFNTENRAKEVRWNDGMSEEEKARISRETYDVAKYLLREYNGTGKTFVLQNWEGDNMMGTNFCRVGKDGYLYDTRTDGSFEDATAETDAKVKRSLQGLVDWFNARQAGVDKAVKELGKFTDVTVKHALEINFIYVEGVDHAPYPYPDSPILLDTVVPYTDCDLYSYSNWQTAHVRLVDTLNERLQTYHDKIGDTYLDGEGNSVARRAMRAGQKTKVMLGEYGTAEHLHPDEKWNASLSAESDLLQSSVIQAQTEIALDFGCEYVLVWQLYCNEPMDGVDINIVGGEQAFENDQMRGYWLIRPDGSFTSSYRYLYSILNDESNLVSEEARRGGVYQTSQDAGRVTVSATYQSSTKPNNVTRAYKNDVQILVSDTGTFYDEALTYAYHSIVKEEGGVYTYQVNFVTKTNLSDYRYFKIETGDGIALDNVVITPDTSNNFLFRMRVGARKQGVSEIQYLASYNVGSGEVLELMPEFSQNFTGKISYTTSNRYFVEVNEYGEVLGKVNGSSYIDIIATGGGLKKPVSVRVLVAVMAFGEELVHDSFEGYYTVSYEDDEKKTPGTELAGFGSVNFAAGVKPKYFEQFNVQFYTLDVEKERPELKFFKDYFNNTSIGYILDWNAYNYCYVTYKTAEDVGGFSIELNTFGANAMDTLHVYVSPDNSTWTEITCNLRESKVIGLGYYYNLIVNRQLIPEGMRYIRIRLNYADSNRWNPQMYDVKIYGAAEIASSDYIDAISPELTFSSEIPEEIILGSEVSLPQMTVSDNYATAEEMADATTCRVFYFMDGGFLEITPTDGKFTPTIGAIYKVEYTAYDLAGNRAVKNFYFQGVAAKEKGEEGVSPWVFVAIGSGAAVVGGIVFVVVKVLIKKGKKAL